MNSESVDLRLEMREAVDLALMRAPVVFRPPVLDQFLQVGEIGAVLPRRIGNFIGKARLLEPRAQVVKDGVGHLDAKRFDFFNGHRSLWILGAGVTPAGGGVEPNVGFHV